VIRGLATVAVAVALATALGGCSLLPAKSAAPAASADATAAPLAAGTYTTKAFQPATTYTVGTDWTNPADSVAYFNLMPVGDDTNGIHLFHNPAAMSQAAGCPTAAEPGVGSSSLELIAWIRSLKGFVVSSPAMVTVGGVPGTSIDVRIADTWTQSCPFANGIPTVPLFYGKESQLRWAVAGNERLRLMFVDLPGNGTVIVDLDSFDGTGMAALLTNAAPAVKSLSFAGG
jgi:hypothetical protein